MDSDLLSKMKVEELKNFLRLRGLKVSGKKEELVARAFVAIENNVQVVQTAEEVEAALGKQYSSKLNIFVSDDLGNHVIPDPLKLDEGWICEKEGVKDWPSTLYPDIFHFLAFHPSELSSKDLSDYKTSKGYNYYEEGWLKPLSIHKISDDSPLCLLKTTCRPSQKLSDVPHKLWVCLEKATGRIMAAHCSCMAGMGQTCNHVAAALFRIEAAVRMGLSNPASTSKPCEWLPNAKDVKPVKVKDLKLVRGNFGRRGQTLKKLNSSPKKNYKPIINFESSLTLADVTTALRSVCEEKDSIIFTSELKEDKLANANMTGNLLSTFDDVLASIKNLNEFISKLEYFADHKEEIEKETRGQSDNAFWFSARKHCITASKAHDVMSRMVTYKRNFEEIDFISVMDKVSGRTHLNVDLPAIKYGRAMEAEAVAAFFSIYSKEHKNAKILDCGLFLCKDVPFVGASPDRIIVCDCCGESCLEVKCPFSISHTSPTDPNVHLPYLMLNEDSTVMLNRKHKYFTQCQVQMAATEMTRTYFFVWTSHGNFTEKLYFNSGFWSETQLLLKEFYLSKYIPYVLQK